MKQVVLFHRPVEIGDFSFQAGMSYTFELQQGPFDKYLSYQGQALISLSLFANYYTDQNHAQWVDEEMAVA